MALAAAPWPDVPEPAVIVLDAGDTRSAAWLADNVAFAPADRDAILGPIRRTWAAAFDLQAERVAVLVLEAPSQSGGPMAEAAAVRAIVTRSRLILLGDLTRPTPMIDRAREALGAGKGARTPAELLIELTRLWTDRYLAEVLDLDRTTAVLEDSSFSEGGRADVDDLNEIRRTAALLRRRAVALRTAIACVTALEGTHLTTRTTIAGAPCCDSRRRSSSCWTASSTASTPSTITCRTRSPPTSAIALRADAGVGGVAAALLRHRPSRREHRGHSTARKPVGVLGALRGPDRAGDGAVFLVKRLRWLPRQDLRLNGAGEGARTSSPKRPRSRLTRRVAARR